MLMSIFGGSHLIKICGLHFTLLSTCLVGDRLLQYSFTSKFSPLIKAAVDNIVHGIVAVVSWAIITDAKRFAEALLCGGIACLIDVDHFISARSFNLKDALNLSSRPPFHNTLLLLVPFIGLMAGNLYLKSESIRRYSWMYATAVLSHHIRDGYRRGILLDPLYNIPPYPYWVYIITTATLPLMFKWFANLQTHSITVPNSILPV